MKVSARYVMLSSFYIALYNPYQIWKNQVRRRPPLQKIIAHHLCKRKWTVFIFGVKKLQANADYQWKFQLDTLCYAHFALHFINPIKFGKIQCSATTTQTTQSSQQQQSHAYTVFQTFRKSCSTWEPLFFTTADSRALKPFFFDKISLWSYCFSFNSCALDNWPVPR